MPDHLLTSVITSLLGARIFFRVQSDFTWVMLMAIASALANLA